MMPLAETYHDGAELTALPSLPPHAPLGLPAPTRAEHPRQQLLRAPGLGCHPGRGVRTEALGLAHPAPAAAAAVRGEPGVGLGDPAFAGRFRRAAHVDAADLAIGGLEHALLRPQ